MLGRALAVAGADAAGDRGGRAVGEEVEDAERHAEHGAGDAEPAERPGAEVPDDRGVGQDVERLGRERAERRDREPQDLAVVPRPDRPLLSHPAYSIRLMDAAPPIRFAELARRIGAAAARGRAGGAGVPHAAAPLRSRRARSAGSRAARWSRCGCGPRPTADVVADMVEGVIVANGLTGDAAGRVRATLLQAVGGGAGAVGSGVGRGLTSRRRLGPRWFTVAAPARVA